MRASFEIEAIARLYARTKQPRPSPDQVIAAPPISRLSNRQANRAGASLMRIWSEPKPITVPRHSNMMEI
jgi:hypothetical protein